MPAPFSRLQLAAALIEYDNDPDDPGAPKKSAQQSAIFAHFRRNPAARPDVRISHSNHLGVALPTDNGASQDGRGSAMGTRRSRGSRNSLDALRNPFGTDSIYDEEREEEEAEMEVDLSSWGLDDLIPKEKVKSKGKQKSPAPTLAVVRSRTISGGPNEFGEIPGPMGQSKSLNSLNMRRQSTSSRLELGDNPSQDPHQQRRRVTSQSTIPPLNQEGSVPFPLGRSQSPGYDHIGSPNEAHHLPRSQSRASIGSRGLLDGFRDDDDPLSQGIPPEDSDNPFALQRPAVTSRFDPKAQQVHARTISQGSLGSRALLDYDAASAKSHDSDPRDRPYSVVELLRPKVLVMPSPLQPVGPQSSEENKVRDGFQMSRDGPPLPPGARPMSRRLSSNLDNIPVPSHSFIPNSTAELSYSQKIFRNTLMPGASGGDAEGLLPRALEDGEQIQFEAPVILAEEDPGLTDPDLPKATGRPAGKLYGKSLIDDLEARKQAMRNKQRVFTGDQRPSMMARNSSARLSTFIDPATLNDPPAVNRNSTFDAQGSQNALGRRNSFKPLLNFDNDKVPQTLATPDRVAKNKSVFGVDTLWEREMVKLRELQEQERIEEEARRKAEEEEARDKVEKEKKKKRKKKGSPDEEEEADGEGRLAPEAAAEPRVSIEPPVLPDIIKPTPRRAVPKVEDDESSEESDDDAQVVRQNVDASGAWHSDSEDDDRPRRTTGVGLRNPKQVKQITGPARQDSDSEEDLPLTVARQRVQTRGPGQFADSDDEDRPLAQVLREPKSKSAFLDINFDNLNMKSQQQDSDDEDSQPLGLRASTMMLNRSAAGEDDDDKPLAFHPEQQRRTQFQMFAAAQQQQQQQQQQAMMMQAQFTNSMFFNQPMMTGPYFPPPMMGPPMNSMAMMQPPMPIPSPPPIHDQSKYMSVDRWRRDVAIDGER